MPVKGKADKVGRLVRLVAVGAVHAPQCLAVCRLKKRMMD